MDSKRLPLRRNHIAESIILKLAAAGDDFAAVDFTDEELAYLHYSAEATDSPQVEPVSTASHDPEDCYYCRQGDEDYCTDECAVTLVDPKERKAV